MVTMGRCDVSASTRHLWWIAGPIAVLLMVIMAGCHPSARSPYDRMIQDGVAAMHRGDPKAALVQFERAGRLDPLRADAFIGQGNAHNVMGQYAAAVSAYKQALAIDATHAATFVNRGIAYSHLGQYERAIADYETALALNPAIDDPPGFFTRLFDNAPFQDRGIRRYLHSLKNNERSARPAKKGGLQKPPVPTGA